MNSVNLIGNLATDVELKEVNEESKVASFVIAVDRFGKSDEADFIRVSTWNGQAESCSKYLSKGKRVAIDGRLRSRSWTTEAGEKRYALEVVANRVQFLTPPPANGAQSEAELATVAAGESGDDIPF